MKKGDETSTKQGLSKLKIAGLILLGLIVVGGIAGSVGENGSKNAKTASDSPSSTEEEQVQAITVNIDTLIEEFDANQLAAEEKYDGKTITTTGELANISEDFLGSKYITLSGTEQFNFTQVQCTSFKDESILTSLTNGTQTTVTGDFYQQLAGNIVLEDCVI